MLKDLNVFLLLKEDENVCDRLTGPTGEVLVPLDQRFCCHEADEEQPVKVRELETRSTN